MPTEENTPTRTREGGFDELAKGLANHSISRRQVFKWFGGAVLGGLLAAIPGVALADQPAGVPQGPPSGVGGYEAGSVRCGEVCCPTDIAACTQGQRPVCSCTGGITEAGGPPTFCPGTNTCSDLTSDAFNCGTCGNVCESGVCAGGTCAVTV
jgi:hypothetical protein